MAHLAQKQFFLKVKELFPNKIVYNINNASYKDNHFEKIIKYKDFKKSKKNFMYFAGAGNVHKGLDILLESFKGLDCNLYVVGHIDSRFFKIMKPLFNEENIYTNDWQFDNFLV